MNKHVQIRDLKASVHARLAENANKMGLSLSQYLRQELEILAARPSQSDVFQRLRNLPRMENLDLNSADILQAMRKARTDHLMDVLDESRSKT